MRAVAGALVLLLPAVAGCAQLDRVLERDPRPVLVSLASETFEFDAAPAVPPPTPQNLSDRHTTVFDVRSGAQDLNVTIVVTFAAPFPPPLPQGQVTVQILAPDGTGDETTLQRDGTVTSLVAAPAAGGWSVLIEAQGEGSAQIDASVLVVPARR